jgi:hypothetical protein
MHQEVQVLQTLVALNKSMSRARQVKLLSSSQTASKNLLVTGNEFSILKTKELPIVKINVPYINPDNLIFQHQESFLFLEDVWIFVDNFLFLKQQTQRLN